MTTPVEADQEILSSFWTVQVRDVYWMAGVHEHKFKNWLNVDMAWAQKLPSRALAEAAKAQLESAREGILPSNVSKEFRITRTLTVVE